MVARQTGAAVTFIGVFLILLGFFGGPLGLSIAGGGVGYSAYITLPPNATCFTGSTCQVQGQYTINGVGAAGENLGPDVAYTLGTATVSTTDSYGFFTVYLPSQASGSTGTITIPIPGSTLKAVTQVSWNGTPAYTWTVQVSFGGTPVQGAQVSAMYVNGAGPLAIEETNAQGTATFSLAGYSYPEYTGQYQFAVVLACGTGNGGPITATATDLTDRYGGQVSVALPAACSIQTQTQTVTTTSVTVTTTISGTVTTETTTTAITGGTTVETVTVTSIQTTTVSGVGHTTTVTHTNTQTLGGSGGSGSNGGINYYLVALGLFTSIIGAAFYAVGKPKAGL